MPIRAFAYLWFLIVLTCLRAATQTTPNPATDFRQEAVVVEDLSTSYSVQEDGTSTLRSHVRARVQSEAGVQQYGLITFAYDNSREEVEIQVRVRRADGTVIETPVAEIQDMTAEISRSAPKDR